MPRPPKIIDVVNWRDMPEDDYYRAHANPLPRPWYWLVAFAQRCAAAFRLIKRRRQRRPRPMPTGNCNRQASR